MTTYTPTQTYVIGGMDPTLSRCTLDLCVQALALDGQYEAAAWLIAGWAVHREGSDEPLAWHRLLSGVRVEVGVAA